MLSTLVLSTKNPTTLVVGGSVYDKAAKQYAKNNSEDENDRLFLIDEYNELVNNEHLNDCNNLFL